MYTSAQLDLRRRMGLPVPSDAPVESPPATPDSPVAVPETQAVQEPPGVTTILPPDSTRPKRKRRTAEDLTGIPQAVVDAAVRTADATPLRVCTVFVGCLPSRGNGYTIEEALGDVLQLAARDGATTYPSYLVVPYGRGPLLVACEVSARAARQELVLPAQLFVPPGHPCAAALVPVLAAAGCDIVRCVA